MLFPTPSLWRRIHLRLLRLAIQMRYFHLHRVREILTVEILSIAFLFGVAVFLLEFHLFRPAISFFSCACALFAARALFGAFKLSATWKWAIIIPIFISTVAAQEYLVGIVIQAQDEYYSALVSQAAADSKATVAKQIKPGVANSTNAKKDDKATAKKLPSAYVGIDRIEVGLLHDENTLAMNIYVKNMTAILATNEVGFGIIVAIPTNEAERVENRYPSESTLEKSWQDFEKSRNLWKKMPTTDLGPGEGKWGTGSIEKIDDLLWGQLKTSGEKVLLLMHVVLFTDESGSYEIDSCRWIQPPFTFEHQIWHFCNVHNGIKRDYIPHEENHPTGTVNPTVLPVTPLEVAAFDSTSAILIANDSLHSIYVISLLINIREPRSSTSFELGFNIEPGKTYKHPLSGRFHLDRTVNKLADTWKEHLEKANALYQTCGIQLAFFSPSDPNFQQMKDFIKHPQGLAYDDISGVLFYRIQGFPETRKQPVPLVVTAMVNGEACPL